ncbi:MAG: c-type cytochrome [Rhodospirillaceae bacterium]|nr:c-type cytochrome [Rhodospirillaceae bacterium]
MTDQRPVPIDSPGDTVSGGSMAGVVAKVFIFLLVVLGAFQWVGYSITDMTGGEKKASTGKVEIGPEGGEQIFWGKGRCYTCHSLGGRGSAVRGPNLGQFGEKFPEPIGVRAITRAKERSEKTGEEYTRTDYIAESIAKPGAYVVKGYKNEMAVVYAPPISLKLDEIKAVVTYLQSQGGDFDLAAVTEEPGEITERYFGLIAASSAAGGGDPAAGEEVYDDNCSECHMLNEEGGEIGPDLTGIGTKTLKFLADAILEPAKSIPPGFETYELIDKEGRKHIGLKTDETAEEVTITKATGDEVTVAKSDIKTLIIDKNSSVMPADLNEALTVKDYQDLLSYLVTQKPKSEEAK